MSEIKKCKRCKYNKNIYEIDYNKSAQEQKIYCVKFKVCKICDYIRPEKYGKRNPRNMCYEINKYPDDLNVDLSKIIHIHNHNKYRDDEIKYIHDNNNKLIKINLIKRYKCDICDKLVDYIEIKEEYDLSNIGNDVIKIKNIIDKIPLYNESHNSEIEHIHNHNKFDYIEIRKYNNKNNKIIKLSLINHYKCDFCNKEMNYTEIKEEYDLSNIRGDTIKIKSILSNIPKCAKNFDNSEIEHIHNHNRFDYIETQNEIFDKNNKIIKLTLINHYKCDFCKEGVNYIEKKEYDINNLTENELKYLCEIMHEYTNICPKTWKRFKKYYEYEGWHEGRCWFGGCEPDTYDACYGYCSECNKLLESEKYNNSDRNKNSYYWWK